MQDPYPLGVTNQVQGVALVTPYPSSSAPVPNLQKLLILVFRCSQLLLKEGMPNFGEDGPVPTVLDALLSPNSKLVNVLI